jgi:uncharacterized protein
LENSQQIQPEEVNFIQIELQNLMHSVVGVTSVVMATADGFAVAHAATDEVDSARIAALSSSISAIGQVAADEAKLGASNSIIVDTKTGCVAVYSVQLRGIQLVLMIIANSEALIAQLNYRANALSKQLAKI